MGDVNQALTQDFPVFAAGAAIELAGLFVGPEDLALLAAAKAKGFVVKPLARAGEKLWGIFKGGRPATPGELAALRSDYEALKKNLAAKNAAPCFPAGTLVAAEHGPKVIERIQSHERVWAYDLKTNRWSLSQVIEPLSQLHMGSVVAIRVAGETIEATGSHPSGWSKGKGWRIDRNPTTLRR
jgi:hypothetical protein